MQNFAVVGGAGFIGSHFVDRLLGRGHRVTVIDNLCSGTVGHISHHIDDSNFTFKNFDVTETQRLAESFQNIDTVIHLASNPDIAKAAVDPRVDFVQGTVLTESVIEAARIASVNTVLYASGSGVYGDAGLEILDENSPIRPISTYGASKAAGEFLLESYSYMFGIESTVFRFANVVGARQTHGVGFDFLNRLNSNPKELKILGNGLQSKSYVHVEDVVSAVLLAAEKRVSSFEVFNISTEDFISVNEIAELVCRELGIQKEYVNFLYSGGERGWKADVPIVRLASEKIRMLGWIPKYNSKLAVEASIIEMRAGLF